MFCCTTIIETGIDIPNAITMIVEDADKFGLANFIKLEDDVVMMKEALMLIFFIRINLFKMMH